MPTGYTAAVADGRVTTFEVFAWNCARAFGALVTMRDDPHDAPIPASLVPDPYYAKREAACRATLAEAEAWTADQAQTKADEAYEADVASYEKRAAEMRETERRYRAMLARVDAWELPSPEHVCMRDFMRQQLMESIRWDCAYVDAAPTRRDGEAYRIEVMTHAARALRHATEAAREELARIENRNRWLAELRASIGPPPAGAARIAAALERPEGER